MSQAIWGAHLVRTLALKSGRLDQEVYRNVDELLVWLKTADTAKDRLYSQCEEAVGNSKSAQFEILKLLDACLFKAPLDVRKVFGAESISKSDQEAVRSRYKRLTSVFHPDRGLADEDWLNDRMALINKAYTRARELAGAETQLYTDYIVQAGVGTAGPVTSTKSEHVYSREEQQRDLVWSSLEIKLLSQLQRLTTAKVLSVASLGLIAVLVTVTLESIRMNSEEVIASTTHSLEAIATVPTQSAVLENGQISDLVDELLAQTSTRIEPREVDQTVVDQTLVDQTLVELPIDPQSNSTIEEYSQRQKQTQALASVTDEALKASLPSNIQPLSESKINAEDESSKEASSSAVTTQSLLVAGKEIAAVTATGAAVLRVKPDSGVPKALSPVLVPESQPMQAMLKSLQISFSNSAAQNFGDHFAQDATYFDEKGRTAIVSAREKLFKFVDIPEMTIDVADYRYDQGWYFLHGDLKQRYILRDHQVLTFCEPVDIVVGTTDKLLQIHSVTRAHLSKGSC